MLLSQALRVQPKEIIALVGGGGKTTAMFQLANELAAQGKRVVTTTTTRIFAAQIKLAPHHIPLSLLERGKGEGLTAALAIQPHTLIIGEETDDGKARGISPELVDEIAALEEVDALIYEADGARMRPFKAPAEHEPVISKSTTLLIPVVGIHAHGAPLTDEHVHRAELVARVARARLNEIITPLIIARVLASPRGGLKNKPPTARVVPLINQVENAAQLDAARQIARLLLGYAEIDAVAIGAVRRAEHPIRETHRRVAAIITAGGAGTRMQGRVKQLLKWRDTTLIENALELVTRAEVAERVLVLGAHSQEIRAAIEHLPVLQRGNWRIVLNSLWQEGHAASIRAGLASLAPNSDAAIFINADQPFLTTAMIDAVIQRYRETDAPIVRALFADKPGSPALFDRAHFAALAALRGDEGGRALIAQHAARVERVGFDDARAGMDVDTPEDYVRAQEMIG